MEKRNRQISLPTDTTVDILRHLSRRKLSRDLYFVNRNIWQIATSSHLVPNVHLIKKMFVDTRYMRRRYMFDDIQQHVRDFNPDTNSGYGNLIGIHNNSEYYRLPVSYFVQKYSALDFVRFGKVWIQHCEDESLIEFLSNAKESFIGCNIKIDFYMSTSNLAVNNFAYLVGNAFNGAAKIALNEAEHFYLHSFNYTQELHCALLNWLHDTGNERNTLVERECKRLVLGLYPILMILDMVEHIKQAFEDENSPPAAFLVTFLALENWRDIFGLTDFFAPCLGGEHDFSLTKTGEKISFFKTKMRGDCVYRIWRRKVLGISISDMCMEHNYKYQYIIEG